MIVEFKILKKRKKKGGYYYVIVGEDVYGWKRIFGRAKTRTEAERRKKLLEKKYLM